MVCQGHQRHQGRRLFCGSGKDQKSPSVISLIDIESNEAPEIPAENDLPEDLVESSIEPSPESPDLASSDFTALEAAEIPGEEAPWDPLATEEIEVEEVLEDLTTDSSSLTSEQPAANSQEEETSEETTEFTIETNSEVTEAIDPVAESEIEEDAIVAEAEIAEEDTESEETTDDSEEEEVVSVETTQDSDFTSGVFTVGDTGEVTVDFLFDGGGYQGELAIFSLNGMEEFEPGSEEFIREAAGRALSNSTSGYVVIADPTEGAKFTGELGEGNSNSGEYLGAKTFTMQAGDQFGFMLVANGRVQQVFDNPDVGGALRPLFSMATANPDDAFHVGQIADVTGNGNTFVMEDLRVDTGSDRDYNDLIFQVRGATGSALRLDDVIDPSKDWRDLDLGQLIPETALDVPKTEVTPPIDIIQGEKPNEIFFPISSSGAEAIVAVPDPVSTAPTAIVPPTITEVFFPSSTSVVEATIAIPSPVAAAPAAIVPPTITEVFFPSSTSVVEATIAIPSPVAAAPAANLVINISSNQAPIVPSANVTLGLNENLDRYFFTAYDSDDLDPNMAYHNGGSIQQYYFQDVNTNSNSGYFTLNGVKQNGGFSLPASAIHDPHSGIDLKFFAASQTGVSDTIQVSAYDGKTWGNPGVINVNTTLDSNRVPVVTAYNQTISPGTSLSSSFFTAADPDGDTIQRYSFSDTNKSSNSGYFVINGQKQTGDIDFILASQLANVRYVAGSQGTAETIRLGAYDGKAWGYRDINVATQDKQYVVNNGGWWADYYQGDFQQYKGSEQLPDQAAWGKLFKSWGHGGPVGMTDNFSARLTGKRYFEPGQYQITAGADDRIRVRIDGKEIITAWAFGAPGKQVYFDSPGGYHTIEIDYKEDAVSAVVSLDWLLTKPLQENRAPVVTTTNRTLGTNTSIPVSNLFTFSDPDGDTIQTYHFGELDSSTTSGGYLTYKGVRLTGGRWVQVNASQLDDVRFVAGPQAGTDKINIQVYDGKTWSNFTSVTLTTQQANRSPIVTFSSKTVDISATTNADFFTVTDPDGDVIQQYMFTDNTSSSTSGYFTLNGVKQTGTFSVAASQLASVKFVGGSQVGSDSVSVYAYDGKTWAANTGTINTVQPNRAPVVTTYNQTLNTGVSTSASNFFTVSDADGDTIVDYIFTDNNSSSTSGYFTLNGVKQTGSFYIAANQLANVRFVGGSQAGTDSITVRAGDGKFWSNDANVILTTQQPNRVPVVTAYNNILDTGTSITASNFFTVSDADGDTIQQYYFTDYNSSSTSGYLTFNGVRQNAGFYVAPSQLANVRFVAGSQAGKDDIVIQAYDGKAWNSLGFGAGVATLTTKQANRAPIVTTTNRTLDTGTRTAASNFFTVSDPDGDTIQRYYFSDTTSSSTSGYFTLNGVKQTSAFYADASQLVNVQFVAGSQAGTDVVGIQAYDGKNWSDFPSATITTKQVNRPPVITPSNQTLNTGTSIAANFFTVSDPDGDTIVDYIFTDNNSSSTSGYFTVNGVKQTGSFYVAANQLANVKFFGGSQAGTDSISVRAGDGKVWSSDANIILTTQQPNRAPIVTTYNRNLNVGTTTNADFFTVSDPDGDAIQYYYFTDNNSDSTSGYFTLNGVKQTTGFSVASNQLASVKFVAGSQAGSDSVTVYAHDGKTWSSGANTTLLTIANNVNKAPTYLQFTPTKSTYNQGETISFNGGWVYDENGASDLTKVDFWLQKDNGAWQDISDTTSFTPYSGDNRWAGFNRYLTGLSAGTYKVKAQAYDKSGAVSEWYQNSFSVQSVNQAPTSLQFNTTKGSYKVGETVSLTGGRVFDPNGTSDLSRVDFRLKKDGVWQDITDTFSFTADAGDNRWGNFNTSLSSLGVGSYELSGVAYDKAGAVSNSASRTFTVYQEQLSSLATIDNLSFDGKEGSTGTFQVRLAKAPTSNVTLTFNAGKWLTVDADNDLLTGTNNTITFTPSNWNQARTVKFIAENDDTSANRVSGNTISYTLSGGQTGTDTYNLGTISNTYTPDTSRYNIDLDFRNDETGFWKDTTRRAIAKQAADDWAKYIANELDGKYLNNQTLGMVGTGGSGNAYSFTTNRYIDDFVVFVGAYGVDDGWGGWGGVYSQLGGWSTSEPLGRAGKYTVNAQETSSYSRDDLYSVISHEIGHTLGLVGQNLKSQSLIYAPTPQTAVFKGEYAKAAYGGTYVPLQPQLNSKGEYTYGHTAGVSSSVPNGVQSMMSYGWTYNLQAPTNIDYAMLADIGYKIKGVNA